MLLRYVCENLYSISTKLLDGKIKVLLAGQDWWTDFSGQIYCGKLTYWNIVLCEFMFKLMNVQSLFLTSVP